jgi:hypothetical protein
MLDLYFGFTFAIYVLTFILFLFRQKGEYTFLPWLFWSAVMGLPATASVYFFNQIFHFATF